MIWVDRMSKQIGNQPQHIDDMFTPSGFAHMGSLRGPILHDVIYRVLKKSNKETVFTYVFNDFDTIDGLPPDLVEKFSPYFAWPLRKAPSPVEGYKSFAEYFSSDFKKVLESMGFNAHYYSSWDMYHEGKFNDVIKITLNNREKILNIYKEIAGYKKKSLDWYPLQVICPQCGKLGTTKVTGWDGKLVSFICEPELVSWAKGCGYTGLISPFDGNGKLPWKVDWPANWKVLGITFEGAGKDHASKGGSYDIAFELCDKVFQYPRPYYFPYEFFLFGGKKMASSKGIGLKARDLTTILPPELARFLIVRIPPQKTLEFDPSGDAIPNLFDDYDRCLSAYYDIQENKTHSGKPGEVLMDFARIFELSEVKAHSKHRLFIPRFRVIVNLLKSRSDLLQFFEKQKKAPLTPEEKEILEKRQLFAQIYLKSYAQKKEEIKEMSTSSKANDLTEAQRIFLTQIVNGLENIKPDRDELQELVFSTIKKTGVKPREVFKAFYMILIGKEFGPKAADIILDVSIEKTKKILTDALDNVGTGLKPVPTKTKGFPTLTDDAIFSIDSAVKTKYPSISIGVAIIKGVTIKKTDEKLQSELNAFLTQQTNLTTELINTYPEVLSYRKLYKEMKVDWHSRRPSPEALLRRIATKKGLYNVNTLVDAYNLVVMKHRVSVGAFDLDKIKFPTVLRFPKQGDKILLLGDKEPTEYETAELAYFDREGGYNIDFNFRDAQRTAVYEDTKNIILNVDGVYDVTREKVEQSLKESIEIIQKYCGGKVELAAIVT